MIFTRDFRAVVRNFPYGLYLCPSVKQPAFRYRNAALFRARYRQFVAGAESVSDGVGQAGQTS